MKKNILHSSKEIQNEFRWKFMLDFFQVLYEMVQSTIMEVNYG